MRSGWKGRRGVGEGWEGGERRGVKSTAAETQKIRCQSQTQNHGGSEKNREADPEAAPGPPAVPRSPPVTGRLLQEGTVVSIREVRYYRNR